MILMMSLQAGTSVFELSVETAPMHSLKAIVDDCSVGVIVRERDKGDGWMMVISLAWRIASFERASGPVFLKVWAI